MMDVANHLVINFSLASRFGLDELLVDDSYSTCRTRISWVCRCANLVIFSSRRVSISLGMSRIQRWPIQVPGRDFDISFNSYS
jgi:hypothetical protein